MADLSQNTGNNEPPATLSCFVPPTAQRTLPDTISPERESFIVTSEKLWKNFTVIHFYLAPTTTVARVTSDDMHSAVRLAFEEWKDIGTGLKFVQVDDPSEAEIRITFDIGGSWSYVGTDNLSILFPAATMNFGWDITRETGDFDTALHEIGHALGAQHEHQNWNAGIEWDVERTVRHFSGAPNFWPRDRTEFNIIRKLPPRFTSAGPWDKDSIMHYTFQPNLAISPEEVRRFGVRPRKGLTEQDREWIRKYYPAPAGEEETRIPLEPFRSVMLDFGSEQQRDYLIENTRTRSYVIATFGGVDTSMSLFELDDAMEEPRFMAEDDDSGEDRNARIIVRLFSGRRYVLRVRMVFGFPNSGSVMLF